MTALTTLLERARELRVGPNDAPRWAESLLVRGSAERLPLAATVVWISGLLLAAGLVGDGPEADERMDRMAADHGPRTHAQTRRTDDPRVTSRS